MKVLLTLVAATLALTTNADSSRFLKTTQVVALPGVKGRLDHLAVDVAGQRLFVSALENDTVEVIDLKTGKRLRTISDLKEPQGLLFLPKPNLLFVASGGDGRLKMYDCDSFRAIKTVGNLPDADNLRYDPLSSRVYVGYGNGALAVVNAVSGVHTIDIQLRSHPESFQLEEHGSRIYVNVPRQGGIAVADRLSRSVELVWPLHEARNNFPMVLDEDGRRLYVGCRKPPRLLALDTEDGKMLSQAEISGDTDDLFLDSKRKRLYACCGEGFVDVLELREGNSCVRVEQVPTSAGARTGLWVPELGLLCLAVPQRPAQQCEVRLYQAQP